MFSYDEAIRERMNEIFINYWKPENQKLEKWNVKNNEKDKFQVKIHGKMWHKKEITITKIMPKIDHSTYATFIHLGPNHVLIYSSNFIRDVFNCMFNGQWFHIFGPDIFNLSLL